MATADHDAPRVSDFAPRLAYRHAVGYAFLGVCIAGTLVGLIVLAILLIDVWRHGQRVPELGASSSASRRASPSVRASSRRCGGASG